jgi:hypothetical protein
MGKNVKLKKNFSTVCVWEGTLVEGKVEEFEKYLLDELGARVQYLEEIRTKPGKGGEGGRNDVFFAVHDKDVSGRFAPQRLAYGIRWLDDAISPVNGGNVLYPDRVHDYLPKEKA